MSPSTDTTGPPRRPPRLSREEVRVRLLDAAMAVVRAEGLRVGVSHLALEDLIRAADVPRSTVYRIWPTRHAFYDELVAVIPERILSTRLDQPALTVGDSYVHRHVAEPLSPEQRRAILVESVGVGISVNYENTFASQHWRNFVALAGSVGAYDEPVRTAITEALHKRQVHFIDNMATFYEHTLTEIGLRVRPDLGGHAGLASAISAYIEGLCVARIAAPELVTGPLGGDGSPSLVVAGVLMLIDGFTEPCPAG